MTVPLDLTGFCSCFQRCPKRQRSALFSLPQKWFPAPRSSKLDGRPVGLQTAAAAVRSLQTEMHLHRNATKITQKEGEKKKKSGKGSIAPFGGKSATITGSNVSASKWPPHILQFAVSMVPVLAQTKVVLSLNTTPHRRHNSVRCSLPQKGSSAKVKSERKKKEKNLFIPTKRTI